MASVSVLNSIGTVVHNSPDKVVSVLNSFGTVVHDTPPTLDAVSVLSSFGTVVHNTPPPLQAVSVQNMLGTVIHNSTFVFNVSDITGIVGSPATFDASTQGLPVADYAHEWSWVSVPGGSSYANQSIPFPDNGVNTYFNMTNNQGLWHFEGNANDTSGNSRNGTVTGASLVAGKVGAQAYQFGVADNINFGAASTFISADFSISLWLKGDAAWTPSVFDAIVGASNAFSWSEGFGAFWLNATAIRFFVGDYNTDFVDLTVTPGDWNHIVFTWDGSTIKGYLNGSEVATKAHSSALTGLANDFFASQLGTYGNGEQTIDELAIWDRTLSSDEIYDLYFLQFGSAASGSAPGTNLDDEFTFTPDVEGTYTINLNFYQYNNGQSADGDVDAVISPSGGSIITGSNPTVNLVEASSTGYVLNTYRIQNLSVQRSRTTEQVPFKLGTKGRQSLRLRTNTEFTGSS